MIRLSILSIVIVLCLAHLGKVQGRKGVAGGEQEWAYVNVRPGAHMFWWLYYTTDPKVSSSVEKPLILWLQGGPGSSGTGYGNFKEFGPYDQYLRPRNHTWVKDYNVLIIDNPVGSGFSYVEDESQLSRNNAQIAKDLLECLRGFYKKLPEFRKVPVYIMSESYGGKMAAELALLWYKAQETGYIESNIRGVGFGDSWISPIVIMREWAPYLLNLGFLDTQGYQEIMKFVDQAKYYADTNRYDLVGALYGRIAGTVQAYSRADFYNILTKVRAYGGTMLRSSRSLDEMMTSSFGRTARAIEDPVLDNLMNGEVRRILNVTKSWSVLNGAVFSALTSDFMKPVTDVVDQLLDETNLKVFVYNGQLDLICNTPGVLKWVENLKSRHIQRWKNAQRVPIVVNGIIEGYRKNAGNFGFYWVHRAGHMVPADNPAATAVILKHLTSVH